MSSLIERALGLAARTLPAVAGGPIFYEGEGDTVWMDAAFGRSQFQVETAEGIQIEYTDRDFLFSADRLILNGELATPKRGHRIGVIEKRGDGQMFEVLAPGGAQVYRFCDPQGYMIRVHTKRLR